jgi:hypothetical protein
MFGIIVFFSLCLSVNNIEAKSSKIITLIDATLVSNNYKSKEISCINNVLQRSNYELVGVKHITDFSYIQNRDLTDYSSFRSNNYKFMQSQLYKTNNETAKPRWYVQEKPSCSNIKLYDLEYLKRIGVSVIDFRDSRLGEFSLKGGPSQECLTCNVCIEAYLLILIDSDDELSKSRLEQFGFRNIDNVQKYINGIKYGMVQ